MKKLIILFILISSTVYAIDNYRYFNYDACLCECKEKYKNEQGICINITYRWQMAQYKKDIKKSATKTLKGYCPNTIKEWK